MQNIIWWTWIAATLALFIAKPRWGGLFYLAAVLLAPYGIFYGGNVSIRADLVLAPLMLACQFLGLSRTRPNASLMPVIWLFVLWLIWIALTTLTSDQEFNFVGANGYVRLVMVMIIFSWIRWHPADFQDFAFVYVMTSIPIGLIAVGQILNISAVRALSDEWYSPPSAVVMAMQADAEQLGTLYRAVGVFGNVSPAATYFLLTVCLAISLYSSTMTRARCRWLVLALVASISGGLATLSATFVGGVLLTVLVAIFNSDAARRRKIIVAAAGFVAVLAMIVAFARSNIELMDAHLDYQWERLFGGQLLADRYSSDDGVLAEAMEVLETRLLTGTGWTFTEAFSGDSIYFSILYCSGIIGSSLFIVGLVRLISVSRQQKQCGQWALSWTAIMLLGGLGCTSLLLGRLADGWWAIEGMLISQLAMKPSARYVSQSPTSVRIAHALQLGPKRRIVPRRR